MAPPDWRVSAHAQTWGKMADMEEVGDSSLDVLRNVQQEAKELLRIALQCSVGAERLVDAANGGAGELPLLVRLKREKQSLLKEFIDAKVELHLREQLVSEPLANVSISEDSVEELGESNRGLEEDVLSVRLQYLQDRKILEGLQTSRSLTEGLFPAAGEGESDKYLCSLVDRHTSLSTDVLKNVQELREVQSELDTVKKERAGLQHSCRKLMTQLEDKRTTLEPSSTNSTDPAHQSLCDRLDRLSAEATLLRHTLQSLVVGSGADWSSGDLLDLMLRLGKRFDWQ